MQDTRALTNVEMAACNLPGREPFPPFDPLDWYEEPNLGESSDTARNNEPTQLGTLEAPSGRTAGDSRKCRLDSGKIPASRSRPAMHLPPRNATESNTA